MIWLTQWQCSSNHTALALAWDDAEDAEDAIVEQGEGYFTRGVLLRICGICRGELHVVHQLTAFKKTEQAEPALRVLKVQNHRGNR